MISTSRTLRSGLNWPAIQKGRKHHDEHHGLRNGFRVFGFVSNFEACRLIGEPLYINRALREEGCSCNKHNGFRHERRQRRRDDRMSIRKGWAL